MKERILCLLLLVSASALAQDGAKQEAYRPSGSFGIHVDQDFLASWLSNEDRNYTQGTAFSFTRLRQERYNHLFLPLNGFYFLGDLVRRKLNEGTDYEITEAPATLSFGVSAYTPLTLRSYMPAYGDRPYSSILFVETRRARIIGRNYHSWGFTYGVMGTNIGYDFQGWAHQALVQNRGIPVGWPTQISQGGHFAWQIQNSMLAPLRRRKYDELKEKGIVNSRFGWDAAYGIQTAAGYYTYFGAQASIRIGLINPLNYMNTRTSFMQSGDKKTLIALASARKSRDYSIEAEPTTVLKSRYWEHFAFFYGAPRLWARNNMITGQPNVPSVYALDSKYLNTFVTELEFGYTMTRITVAEQTPAGGGDPTFLADRSFQVTISAKVRTAEYRYEPYTRTHYWGCINIIIPVDARKGRLGRP
jgi:hypothetical protein